MKTTRTHNHIAAALGCALTLTATTLVAQDAAAEDEKAKAAELAMKLQNPVASLISVPIQNNWDFGIGAADAMRYTANVQPVIPFSISENWNLITRTILPIVYAESPVNGGDSKFGLGDTVQSLFFSPKAPTSGGWIWGAGPVLLWPTSTDDALGTGKVGAGPRPFCSGRRKAGLTGLWPITSGPSADRGAPPT